MRQRMTVPQFASAAFINAGEMSLRESRPLPTLTAYDKDLKEIYTLKYCYGGVCAVTQPTKNMVTIDMDEAIRMIERNRNEDEDDFGEYSLQGS